MRQKPGPKPLTDGSTHIVRGGQTFYRKIKVDGRWVKEHRHIMEQLLGRPLLTYEHVHHIDGDGLNNAPENLVVLTKAQHTSVHKILESKWSRNHDACTSCSTTERPHFGRGLCKACHSQERYHAHPEAWITQQRQYRATHRETIRANERRYDKERRANDPVYAERKRRQKREYYHRTKAH